MIMSLPHWIQRLFGIEPQPGEGTAWRIEHAWDWPPWLTLLVAVVVVIFVVAVYLRENSQAPAPCASCWPPSGWQSWR